ncbi:acetamidase/formamidase family protein [Corynebacterium appendicis]|uniref:acetamidase/formamidase family protein n=1 Tax=Corynebacterium appendicis TaxID=163202 RepID=UPI0021B00A5F|nr:acetamidase/formamidase family protein [Corynebacterium appendicis]MCT1684513.1 acetamidase/formamidase family protein [Corynebacterium appendicis]
MHSINAEHFVLSMSAEYEPKLEIGSGDEVTVQTMDCFSGTIADESQLFSSVGWDKVNPATGPIAVSGARPGDTLKVEVLSIEVGDHATMTTHPDFGALPGTVEERTRKIPVRDGKAFFSDEIVLPIRPMIGVIGTAPAGEDVPTGEPRQHGGNMDTKEIVAGSTLYLPVEVDGANLSMGDVHAVMGDGEVAVCGAEIAAEVRVKVTVLSGRPLPLPLLVSGDSVYAISSEVELIDAVTESTRMMRDWVAAESSLDPTDALMLLSLAGDTQISQVVDPRLTARFRLPLSVLEQCGVELP